MLGVNLNQIARRLNAQHMPENTNVDQMPSKQTVPFEIALLNCASVPTLHE